MNGRGAWTTLGKGNGSSMYTYLPGDPLDGEPVPGELKEYSNRVHRGVLAIQKLLTRAGYYTDPTGVYDGQTLQSVEDFQNTWVRPADGVVYVHTMAALLHPVFVSVAASYKLNPALLWGISKHESGHDPGAQGWLNPADSGLFQFNTVLTVTLDQAYSPVTATVLCAKRLDTARTKYSGKGVELRLDCMILQHNSITWADELFQTGKYPTAESSSYVADVREAMASWTP
jgi:hypothetical protein